MMRVDRVIASQKDRRPFGKKERKKLLLISLRVFLIFLLACKKKKEARINFSTEKGVFFF